MKKGDGTVSRRALISSAITSGRIRLTPERFGPAYHLNWRSYFLRNSKQPDTTIVRSDDPILKVFMKGFPAAVEFAPAPKHAIPDSCNLRIVLFKPVLPQSSE